MCMVIRLGVVVVYDVFSERERSGKGKREESDMYVCSMYIICTYVWCTYDGVWYGIKGQGM